MAGRPSRTWDPHKTFDVSPEERAAIEERVRMRTQLKAEFQRKVTNPYRGVGGSVFDPAVQRFLSMRANYWHQFQPTAKGLLAPFFFIVMPIGVLSWLIYDDRTAMDQKCRNGEIAYKDRQYKFC